MPHSIADERNAARNGRRLRSLVRRIRLVGLAGLELVRTLRGSDDVVRMLRIVLALLRHVRTMGLFFTHYSFEALNVRKSSLRYGALKRTASAQTTSLESQPLNSGGLAIWAWAQNRGFPGALSPGDQIEHASGGSVNATSS